MTAELRHLRAFLAIAAEGNITRAATRLHVTQPALSRTLRQLETHLGVGLVDRSTHHLDLTPAGRAFRDRAAAAVAAVDDVLDPARAGSWPLRLGHTWSALGEHTTTLLRAWQQAHPDIPLRLLRIDDRSAGLLQGRTDAAVLREPGDIPGVRTELLTTEERVAAVPTASTLAARARLSLADLTGWRIAINTVTGTTSLDLWPPGAAPAATVEVANTDDWLLAIAAGDTAGVTSTATAVMYPHPAITYLPLTGAAPISLHVAWRPPAAHPAVPALVTLLKDLFGGTPRTPAPPIPG
ncbi:LysR family transcriptional regulator [Actinoplanes utahensis]|uniref:LysR family transcriptional regulator n=1 Tax=Actinoplanes utahensis TaxID=1869 RepID=A0A0A6U7F7_ACTUT|nr:LysR family transcriptional regulator [Actinoplanes utahensis]KHD71995.1 LysR family transcriptional regulator [Actinoplanes utahensis]GIF31666.1 LysR family transcriptional regulator [Actinoplanes utahensis]